VLIGALANPDPELAAQAAAIIRDAREYADLVVPVLTKAADDEEVVVARAALQGLGDLGSYATTALPTFAGAFASEDLGVRYYAADGISKVDREMRETAIAIGAVGGTDQDLVPDLETALQDRPQYSRAAIEALATIGGKARDDAPQWVDQLGTSDAQTRIAAVEALGDINRFAAASVPALVAALADPENQELRQDLTMPGEEPGSYVSVAVTPLLQALNDRDPEVRRTTAQALRQLNAVAADSETALRASPGDDRIVRRITTNTLATIDEYDRLATEALLAALKDDDVAVQRAAAQGLGALGPEAGDAVPGLIEAMKSGDADLQIAAGLALGRIGAAPEQTVPTLVQALESAEQPAVRYQAARALGLLGEQAQSAAPALLAAMKEGDAGLRYQTALALRTIDPAADLDPALVGESRQRVEQEVERLLIAAKGESPDAMLTLASIGPAALPAIPEIVASMDTAAPEQRTELAALLAAISTEGMAEVPPLIAALQTGASAARARAAERLGRIGADAKQAVPALTGGLGTEDLEMRFALAEALGEIGGHTTATTRALVAAAAGDASSRVRREATESLRREARAALEAEGVSTRRGLYEIDRALTN
jgi:HEAT repeat protein